MALDDFYKALGMFQEATKDYAVKQGINDATKAVQDLNQNLDMDINQRYAQQQAISKQLATHLTGLGAPQSAIATAVGAIAPPDITTVEGARQLAAQASTPDERLKYTKVAEENAAKIGQLSLAKAEPTMQKEGEISRQNKRAEYFYNWLYSSKEGKAAELPPEAQAFANEAAKDAAAFKVTEAETGNRYLNELADRFKAGEFSSYSGITGKLKSAVGMQSDAAGAMLKLKSAILPNLKETFGSQLSDKELEQFLTSRLDFTAPAESEKVLRDLAAMGQQAVENKSALKEHLASGQPLRTFAPPVSQGQMSAIMRLMTKDKLSYDKARAKVLGQKTAADGSLNVIMDDARVAQMLERAKQLREGR